MKCYTEKEKKLFEEHIKKVKKAIDRKTVYYVCNEGNVHKINTITEYCILMNSQSDDIFYVYGI